MNTAHRFLRTTAARIAVRLAAMAAAAAAAAAAALAVAPAAFATEVPAPPADGGAAAPAAVHTVVVGGTPGWQIALLAVGAAVLAAAAAVLLDRALRARRAAPGSAVARPADRYRAGTGHSRLAAPGPAGTRAAPAPATSSRVEPV